MPRLTIRSDSRQNEIDARPSDCLALALRAKAPIEVQERVVVDASISKSDAERLRASKLSAVIFNPFAVTGFWLEVMLLCPSRPALPGHDIDDISFFLSLQELTVPEDGELVVELSFG